MGGKTGESVFLSAEGLLWLNKTARDPHFFCRATVAHRSRSASVAGFLARASVHGRGANAAAGEEKVAVLLSCADV